MGRERKEEVNGQRESDGGLRKSHLRQDPPLQLPNYDNDVAKPKSTHQLRRFCLFWLFCKLLLDLICVINFIIEPDLEQYNQGKDTPDANFEVVSCIARIASLSISW